MSASVKKVSSHAVTLLVGNDEFRVKERATALADKLKASAGEWGFELIDGWATTSDEAVKAIRATREALLTPPFMGGDKFVWLKNASFFKDEGPGKGEEVREGVEVLVETITKGLPSGVQLLISALGMDARKKSHKALMDFAKTEKFEIAAQTPWGNSDGATAEIAEERARDAGKLLSSLSAEKLIQLCGSDTRQIMNEVDKLILYVGDAPRITDEDIETMVAPIREQSHYTWCDHVLAGRHEKALVMLRQLKFQEESAPGLLITLGNTFKQALQCKVLLDKRWLRIEGRTAKWDREAETVLPRNAEGNLPSAWRIGIIAGEAQRRSLDHWLRMFRLVVDTWKSFFDGKTDLYAKLELLLLKMAAETK